MGGTEERRFTLPLRAWIAVGVVAALQLGLLALNVLGIARQEQLLERQLGLAERTYDATRPAVQDARRLLDDARDRLPRTKRRSRDAARLVDRSRPLVDELADMDAASALAAAGALAVELRMEDRLVEAVDRTLDLLRAVERAGTPGSIEDLRGTVHEVVSLQRRSFRVQRRTLAIQKKALRHIRSLDRKTGGELP